MSSSLKPLYQFSPDFTRPSVKMMLLICSVVLHYWTRWPPCPLYMVKKHWKIIFSRTKKVFGWILVYCIRNTRSTKFVQMMILGWPFNGKVKFVSELLGNIGRILHFFIWVLWPFQEYFTYIEPIIHQRWVKAREPGKNHLTIRKQNLAFPQVTRARLEPQWWET